MTIGFSSCFKACIDSSFKKLYLKSWKEVLLWSFYTSPPQNKVQGHAITIKQFSQNVVLVSYFLNEWR